MSQKSIKWLILVELIYSNQKYIVNNFKTPHFFLDHMKYVRRIVL